MTKIRKIDNFNNLVFYIAYFFFLLYAFFGTINVVGDTLRLLTNISLLFVGVALLLQIKNIPAKSLFRIILLLIVSMTFVLQTGNYLFLKFLLIVMVSSGISMRDRVSFDMKLRVLFLLIMFVLYSLGVVEDSTFYFGENIRHSMGFSNPNVLGMHTMILCMEIFYLNVQNFRLRKILLCLVIIMLAYLISGSRTALFVSIISTVSMAIYARKRRFFENRIMKLLIIFSPIITAIIVLIEYLLYVNGNSAGVALNELGSGRLSVMNYFANNYEINMFGNNIDIANKSCDVTVVYMLYAFGVVGLMAYVLGFQKLLRILYRKDLALAIIVFLFVLYGISEKLWLFADCNIFMTAFTYYIYDKLEKDRRAIDA